MTITAEANHDLFIGDIVQIHLQLKTVGHVYGRMRDADKFYLGYDRGIAQRNIRIGESVMWDLNGNTEDIMTDGNVIFEVQDN